MKKKPKRDKRASLAQYNSLRYERTRVIGDMLLLPDTSEDYQEKAKLLGDLNDSIEKLEKEGRL